MDGEIQAGRRFELLAGHPALDFVNTLDWRFRPAGPEELLNSYCDLLRFTTQAGVLSVQRAENLIQRTSAEAADRILRASLELREALAQTFYIGLTGKNPKAATLGTLERYFKAAELHQKLAWKNSRLQWDWVGADREPDFPLWKLASSACRLLTSEAVHQVRACDSAECRWLFLDVSKNQTRRWCDMKICGNRMKARRFKAQRSAQLSS